MMRPGPSRDYYLKKRAEGLLYTQALLTLARRRVDVLGAMLRDKRHFTPTPPAPQPAWHHHRDPLDQGVRQVECARTGDQRLWVETLNTTPNGKGASCVAHPVGVTRSVAVLKDH